MRKWIVGCFVALVILPCGALEVEIKLVDIEFKMTSEHNFLTTLDVKWEVQSSTMGGFYLEVPEGVENVIGEQSYAILNARTKVGTEVTKVGTSRYDIDLENGIRFSGSVSSRTSSLNIRRLLRASGVTIRRADRRCFSPSKQPS